MYRRQAKLFHVTTAIIFQPLNILEKKTNLFKIPEWQLRPSHRGGLTSLYSHELQVP